MKNLVAAFVLLPILISSLVHADTNDRLRNEREDRERIAWEKQIESNFASSEQKLQIQNILTSAIFDLAKQFGTTIQEQGAIEINGPHFADVEIKFSNATICNLAWSSGPRGEFGQIKCATVTSEKISGSFFSDGRSNELKF